MKLENVAAGVVVDGKYHLEEILGRGSYGDVWKARVLDKSTGLPEYIAIKFFTNQDRAMQIYMEEATQVQNLDHPRIIKIFDAGRRDGLALIVMEFVPGATLLDRLGDSEQPKPVSLEDAMAWAVEIAEVLAYMHDRNPPVMHCDLKLDNLILEPESGVRLIDFGQSRPLERLFIETAGVGAHPYMAPELLGLDRDRKGRRMLESEVYAFGVILYRMLTGRFPRPTLMDVYNLRPIPRPSELNPRIPKELEELVVCCLENRPERRLRNGKELLGRLQAVRQRFAGWVAADVTPPAAPAATVRSQADELAIAARLLLEQGQVEQAIQQLEKAMQRMSTAPAVLMVYGDAVRRSGKLEAARAVYQRVRKWMEQQGAGDEALRDAVEGLAEVLVQLKLYEEAVQEFAWLVDRWPDRKWYRFRYGVALGMAARYKKSLEILLALQQDHPGLPIICAKIGFAYLQLRRYEEARQYLNEALMLDPEDAYTLYHLARLRALQGREDLAEGYYRRLLDVEDAADLAADLGRLLGVAPRRL